MTAAIIDETLGGLNYVLKREGVVPHGPSFTVHLEVGSGLTYVTYFDWILRPRAPINGTHATPQSMLSRR